MSAIRVAQRPKRPQPRTTTPTRRDLFAQERRNAEALADRAEAALRAEIDEIGEELDAAEGVSDA